MIIANFINAFLTYLNDNKQQLGITAAEFGKLGEVTTVRPPHIIVWYEPEPFTLVHTGEILNLPIGIYLFCSATGKDTADAMNKAINLAIRVTLELNLKAINEQLLELDDTPIEIVDTYSNVAVASTKFITRFPHYE